MAGLLDPQSQGLLGLALGLLEAGGPQTRPTSFGQAIARGGAAGMGAYQDAIKRQAEGEDRELMKRMREMQMRKMLSEISENEAQAKRYEKLGIDPKLPAPIQIVDAIEKATREGNKSRADLLRWAVRNPYQTWGGVGFDTRGDGGPEQVTPTEQIADIKFRLAAAAKRGEESERIMSVTGPDDRPQFTIGGMIRNQFPDGGAFSGARLRSAPPISAPAPEDAAAFNQAVGNLPPQLRDVPPIPGAAPAAGAPRFPAVAGGPPQPLRPLEASKPRIEADTQRAKAEAEVQSGYDKRTSDYNRLMPVIQQIKDEKLLETATGSAVGSVRDMALGAVGLSSKGDEAIGKLNVLSGEILRTVPRFEGPQSDGDREEYRRQAGSLADPYAPAPKKIAALKAIEFLISKYRHKHGERRPIKPSEGGGFAQWDTTVGRWVKVE